MKRFCLYTIITMITIFGLGCEQQPEEPPVWEQVKFRDLAPKTPQGQQQNKLDTLAFTMISMNIPAENLDKLDGVSDILFNQPFKYKRYNAFKANSFYAGFGRVNFVQDFASLLDEIGAQKVLTHTMLFSNGQANDIPIIQIYDRKKIYFTGLNGSTSYEDIGPGILSLRLHAIKTPGIKGACTLTVVPVCPSTFGASIPTIDDPDSKDTFFRSCQFNLQMSPGDFIFIKPNKFTDHHNSLDGLFFCRRAAIPYVTALMITCSSIAD